MMTTTKNITSWKKFSSTVRSTGLPMLKNIDIFPESIMITGCQRSGTTALTRVITQSDEVVDFRFSKDDELDGALILADEINYEPEPGRYCFQTTYLNERFIEYFMHKNGHKIIWVLRNPYSVIYSILHNWRDFAMNELFMGCGTEFLNEREKKWFKLFHKFSVSRIRRACYAYAGKTEQIYTLYKELGKKNFIVIEYDEMVNNKKILLPYIFSFINLSYRDEFGAMLHTRSVNIKEKLSRREKIEIDKICLPVFENAMKFARKNFHP